MELDEGILLLVGADALTHLFLGTDEQKNTFVKLYGLEKCEELVQKYTATAIDALKAFKNTEYMVELANSLTQRRV